LLIAMVGAAEWLVTFIGYFKPAKPEEDGFPRAASIV
jgi:hypothetical protein